MIEIKNLWFTQAVLKRFNNIPSLVSVIQDGILFQTPIELHECEDGEIQIHNGHHRVMALWICSFDFIEEENYILVQGNSKNRFGKINNFYEYYLKKEIIVGRIY